MNHAEYLTPAITVFDQNKNVDEQGNRNIYEYLIRKKIDGIVVMGSMGEFFAMTMEQKKQLIDIAISTINHRVKCFVGTGCMNVAETIDLSNYALHVGADAVMIIGPYYSSMGENAVEWYYDQVIPNIKGDVYIYNFPATTGYDMTPDLTLRLIKKYENIIGYKDTIESFGHTRSIIEAIKKDFPKFKIFTGFDENLAHTMLSGGDGCIGGLSNFIPEECIAWVDAINNGNLNDIEIYQKKINSLMKIYSLFNPFIPAIKKIMELRGILSSSSCLLFSDTAEEQIHAIKKILRDTDIL